jgi:pilus assembly protein FimV
MVLRKLAVALLGVGVMLPGLSHALTIGPDIDVLSALNQPFHGRLALNDLRDMTPDDIHVSMASQEDFERMGIEKAYFLQDLQFNVVINPGGSSYIDITTVKPVVEPALDFVLHVAWPGNDRLNDVTALLDPPMDGSSAAVVSAPRASGVTPPTSSAPAASAAPARQTSSSAEAAPPRPRHGRKARTPEEALSAPAPSGAAAGTYRTRSADTLWKVAQKLRPGNDVTVPQTMIALQHNNPDAFADHNINLLKKGQVLKVPTDAQIRDVSAEQAIASVREQTAAWHGQPSASVAKNKLEAQQVDATSKAPAASKSAAGEPKAQMKLAAAEGSSKSSVAGAGSAGKPLNQADMKKLNENQAKASAFKEDNKQLSSKVGVLDNQVKATDKQLAVENAKLAQLQSQLKDNAAKAGTAPASAMAAPAAASAAVSGTTAGAAALAGSGVAIAAASGSAMAPVASAPKLATPVKSPEAPASAPSSSEDNSGMQVSTLLGIGVVLMGLLAFIWAKFFKKKPEPTRSLSDPIRPLSSPSPAPAAPADDSAFLVAEHDLGDLEPSGDTREVPMFKEPVAADPLEEVEQYLAFERYPQAVGFLVKAISSTPERADLRLKLMEVYVKLKDHHGFDEQEAALADSTDLSVLARVEELRTQLPPRPREAEKGDSIDYAPSKIKPLAEDNEMPSLEELEMDFNATVSASSPNLKALDASHFAPPAAPAPVAPAPAPAPAAEELDFSLDDDLDLQFQPEETVKAPAADDLSFSLDDAEPAHADAHGDLDLGGMSLGDASDLADLDLPADEPAPASTAKASEDDLSFSLDDLDVAAPAHGGVAAAPTTEQPVVESLADEDFSLDDLSYDEPAAGATDTHDALEGDFSLDDSALTAADADEVKLDHVMAESELNDRAADFDNALAEHTAHAEPAPVALAETPAPAGDDGFGMDDEFDFLADADENATKLDLARAYIDMGDLEGARDILNEVVTEGNTAQQDEARGLLSQVG